MRNCQANLVRSRLPQPAQRHPAQDPGAQCRYSGGCNRGDQHNGLREAASPAIYGLAWQNILLGIHSDSFVVGIIYERS